jgi:hypothetical protein
MAYLPSYIASGDMSASVAGASFKVGPLGVLRAEISWVNSAAAVGTLALEYMNLAGGWTTHPLSSTVITTQPNSNAATLTCVWTSLQAYEVLRFTYTRGSGGGAANLLTVRVAAK